MVIAPSMQNSTCTKGALAALLAATLIAGCGGTNSMTSPDPYDGAIDPSALDLKFQPTKASKFACGSSKTCYPAQLGYAHGKQIRFYNMVNGGTVVTGTATLPLATQLPQVFDFPTGCIPGRTIDPRFDAFSFDLQYPVFRTLPLAVTSGTVLPLVSSYSLTASGNTCNDLKTADSIDAGHFGAQVATTPTAVQMWPMVDATANFEVLAGAPAPGPAPAPGFLRQAWSRNLQGSFLDGGAVPVDATGNLMAMDGVIVNSAAPGSTLFPTDSKLVILPAIPGESGYSPIVRLHPVTLPSGKQPGDFTDLCPANAKTCAANQVPMSATDKPKFTLFIVAQPQ